MYVVRKYFRTLESTFVRRYLRTSVLPYERTTDSRVQLYVYSTVHVPSKQLLLNNPKKKSQWVRVRCTVHGYNVHVHVQQSYIYTTKVLKVLSKVLSYNVVCVHSHIQLSYSIGFFSFFSFFSFFFAAF